MEKLIAFRNRTWLTIADLRAREEGQALVEYALLLSLITIVSVTILRALGVQVANIFSNVNTQI